MASKPAAGRARRRSANERYRQGFLSQAAGELREFALLMGEEPDAQESVAFELQRLADTAETLELAAVARAARDAAEEIVQSGGGLRAIRRVASAIRHTGGRLRFGPLVLIGAPADQVPSIRENAELCCEPVVLFEDLTAFTQALHTEQPSAVVLPASAIEAVGQLVSRENFPVLVHGPADAWEQHAAAMEAGALGFLFHPLELGAITRLARWRTQVLEERFEVLVVADPGPAREGLVLALHQVGVVGVPIGTPAELARHLETTAPKAVVLSSRVGETPALPLAMLVRTHARCNHLPILVSGRPEDPPALRGFGVDDVMRSDAPPVQAAQRVRDRVLRMQSLAWERDPITGLANRLGVLAALDAELAHTSRSGEVLSVVLVEIEGLRTAIEVHGSPIVHQVRRVLIELFRRNLRRTDPFGELAPGELLLAMPGCVRGVALRRVERIAERFTEVVRSDPQLQSMSLLLGVADTSEGLSTVAVRAERELRAGGTSSR
jgi:GGDEF domain-containing protein